MRARGWIAIAAALAGGAIGPARAEPYRLRGNAYALSQVDMPVGLLTLGADSALRPWLSAEAVVWVGGDEEEGEADAMVVSVELRDPKARGELQLGRFVVVPGAVRPVHMDGARGRANLPGEASVELFGGVPVVPELGVDSGDWLAGGRVSRRLGEWGSAGIAYLQQRQGGRIDDQEVGLDAGWSHGAIDLAGRLAYDLEYAGVSDTLLSGSVRRGAWRWEAFASHRSPARLLPATSLFTVLGDVATQRLGASARWRAAPRLDLSGVAALRRYDDDYQPELIVRGLLRLDDLGDRVASLELRREGAPDASWTGARAALRLPVGGQFRAAAEAELVVPDDGGERGAAWPWALVSLSRWFAGDWEAAAALEASASPEYDYRIDAIARLSHQWEGP